MRHKPSEEVQTIMGWTARKYRFCSAGASVIPRGKGFEVLYYSPSEDEGETWVESEEALDTFLDKLEVEGIND